MNDSKHLCVTCGEFKDSDAFEIGDCTCNECNEAGRTGVFYDLDEGTGVAVARRCDECRKPLADHAKMWIDNQRTWICPTGNGGETGK